jgi:hypothetical protein
MPCSSRPEKNVGENRKKEQLINKGRQEKKKIVGIPHLPLVGVSGLSSSLPLYQILTKTPSAATDIVAVHV